MWVCFRIVTIGFKIFIIIVQNKWHTILQVVFINNIEWFCSTKEKLGYILIISHVALKWTTIYCDLNKHIFIFFAMKCNADEEKKRKTNTFYIPCNLMKQKHWRLIFDESLCLFGEKLFRFKFTFYMSFQCNLKRSYRIFMDHVFFLFFDQVKVKLNHLTNEFIAFIHFIEIWDWWYIKLAAN